MKDSLCMRQHAYIIFVHHASFCMHPACGIMHHAFCIVHNASRITLHVFCMHAFSLASGMLIRASRMRHHSGYAMHDALGPTQHDIVEM